MKRLTNDLIGKKFGKLTVLRFVGYDGKSSKNRSWWECQCECGKVKNLSRDGLINAKTRSCGCERLNRYPNREIRLYKRYYTVYKSNAKLKKREFNLDFEMFISITKQDCFYCGTSPNKVFIDRDRKDLLSDTTIKCNGVDRVDSLKGYTLDNVVPCCQTCNLMKLDMSTDAFLSKIEQIYKYNF